MRELILRRHAEPRGIIHPNPRTLESSQVPIYEFYCPDNNRIYSFLARSVSYSDRVPRCPDDPAFRMRKMVSRFATRKKGSESRGEAGEADGGDDPFAGRDEAKMESAMMELEREMGGMDEENPDPRQMGRLMRRMCEMTGQEMAGPMEEMVRRMEKGEDPDSLEEEYSDVLDSEEFDFVAKKAGFKRGASARPVRDPVVYEMAEWV